VVMGQQPIVSEVNRHQGSAAADPSLTLGVAGGGHGQQSVQQSSTHGDQRRGRGRQRHRHKSRRGGSSPDGSPDDSGSDHSCHSGRHRRNNRDEDWSRGQTSVKRQVR